jgi:hypothetical protein
MITSDPSTPLGERLRFGFEALFADGTIVVLIFLKIGTLVSMVPNVSENQCGKIV